MNQRLVVPLLRTVLASVFLAASAAKPRSFDQTVESFERTDIPVSLSRPLARIVPACELIIGFGILWNRSARVTAKLAIGLLLAFTAFIWRNVATGRNSNCACFGQHFQSLAGWNAILRNIILLASAVFISFPALPQNMRNTASKLSNSEMVVLSIMILVPSVLGSEGWRRFSSLSSVDKQFNGPKVGDQIPEAIFDTIDGRRLAVSDLLLQSSNDEAIFVFIDPDCGPCKEVVESLASATPQRQDSSTFVVIQNTESEVKKLMTMVPSALHSLMLLDSPQSVDEMTFSSKLDVFGAPFAVVADSSEGRVLRTAKGGGDVAKLLGI